VFPQQGMNSEERRVTRLYRSLSATDRAILIAFGEFLAQRALGAAAPGPAARREPEVIERPGRETVVAALKRLRLVYTMLDHGVLLHEASALMSTHVLQGRPAANVIDELEALFARHYTAYREASAPASPPATQ
jgi:hypothetical protein